LKIQLELFATGFSQTERCTFCEVLKYAKSLSPAMQSWMSEVMKVIKLLLIMPATNAVNERSASALRRVKTYLRTTMHQDRFNHLMILHIHKDAVDKLAFDKCINEFISLNAHRSSNIAKFD